ncbi:hypothetical protein BURK1_02070 [Burkholderiales bacterium]|nr:hypothetical protein BURK1_02070 [Burkholderiales bacterium]
MAVRAPLARAAKEAQAGAGARLRPPARVAAVDALRGIAIVAMIGYHFSFDLRLFGLARFDFENGPLWLAARAAIVATFLALCGVSLVLARRDGVTAARRWRRIGVIAACALAASAASWLLFPRSYIWFGVLHCIAVSSAVAWPFTRHPRLALACGVAVIVAGLALTHPAFDARALAWIGFTTTKPATEDYVPLFPWLGVALVGVAAGDAIARRSFAPLAFLMRAPRTIAWLGRHSLAVYMVHQPVLIGALALALRRLP